MREADRESLLQRAAAARARQAAQSPPPATPARRPPKLGGPAAPSGLDDTLDEVDDRIVEGAQADAYMRHILEQVPFRTAYERYVGKPWPSHEPDSGGNFQISCPAPGHRDSNPSANVKIDSPEGLWVCYGCDERGDKITMIGLNLGLDPRVPQEYMELTKRVCEDEGYEFIVGIDGSKSIVLPGNMATRATKVAARTTTVATRATDTGSEGTGASEVPVHGDGTGLDDVFDLEEAAAKGELTRPAPAALPPEQAFLLEGLDELGDSGPVRPDGKSAKTSILDGVRAKIGPPKAARTPENPPKTAPKPAKTAPKPVKTTETDANPAKDINLPPKFAVPKGLQAQNTKNSAKTTPKPVISAKTNTGDDELLASGGYDELEEGLTAEKLPSIDYRDIIPPDTFIYDYCRIGSADTDVTQEFHFWNAVLAVGLALGKQVALYDSPLIYANLFICSVAATGERKTKANHLFDQVVFNALEYHPESGFGVLPLLNPGSGEALIDQFAPQIDDPTDQANKRKIQHSHITGLATPGELSTIASVVNRQSNTLEATMIDLYDGKAKVSTISRGSGGVEAKHPFCSLSTTVQPRIVRTLISGRMVESGFANRFLWVFGPPGQAEAIGDPLHTAEGVPLLKGQLLRIRDEMNAIARHPMLDTRVVEWDPEARREYTEFFHRTIYPTRRRDTAGLMTRADLIMKKLILIFTANMNKPSVPHDAVLQAMKLWPYLMRCYELIGVNLASSDRKDAEDRVLAGIKAITARDKIAPTARDLWKRSVKSYKGIDSMEDMRKILETLIKVGIVKEVKSNRGIRLALAKD